MAQVALPGVGTNWHTVKMTFTGNRIQVSYDGDPFVDVTDTNFDGGPAYLSGAVSLHLFMNTAFVAAFDDVNVAPLTSGQPTLSALAAGGVIQLSWPLQNLGWRLQVQTNSGTMGLSTNWTDVPDSILTNLVSISIDPAVDATFFRLLSP